MRWEGWGGEEQVGGRGRGGGRGEQAVRRKEMDGIKNSKQIFLNSSFPPPPKPQKKTKPTTYRKSTTSPVSHSLSFPHNPSPVPHIHTATQSLPPLSLHSGFSKGAILGPLTRKICIGKFFHAHMPTAIQDNALREVYVRG